MDSVTQALLGAAVAGACVPREHRRRALGVGAMLGTLPDLDVLIRYGNAVQNFTYHRGFSHSLFVLALFSVLAWLVLRRWWSPVGEAPGRWLMAISLALLTHPLLDAHTAYGTQLLWPLETPPVMWATLFIIDPLYTLPLLVAVLLAIRRSATGFGLRVGLVLSTVYLGWSWVASSMVLRNAAMQLADRELATPLFATPTPFNTLLWRVVAKTPTGYLEAFDSLAVAESPWRFVEHRCITMPPGDPWTLDRLNWFASGLTCANEQEDQMVISDLRMGQAPAYVFSFAVAQRQSNGWQEMAPRLLSYRMTDRGLDTVWERIWSAKDGTPIDPEN